MMVLKYGGPSLAHDPRLSLTTGLYEKLIAVTDQQALDALGDPQRFLAEDADGDDVHHAVAQHLEHLLASSLSMFRGKQAAEKQRRLVDRVIQTLIDELGDDWAGQYQLANPLRRLLAIHAEDSPKTIRPDTPLARSAMLTGTRLDPSLASQLNKEIATADRVDILCSFIKWTGLRLIRNSLLELTAKPMPDGSPRLRIITTSYMGATDPKAVEELSKLPNTDIRVSYDTKRTRLHAKAYMIHRHTGFGSAYVGSANLSSAALSEGLEWTPKISQYELPYLWDKVTATFENYWNDPEFEAFDEAAQPKLVQAIHRERHQNADTPDQKMVTFDLHPYPYQEEILDCFAAERQVQEKFKHLLIAATGTGKTMIAAFDYKRWRAQSRDMPRLLFIAHREEILKQAMGMFRGVLRDQNFGDLLVGGYEPQQMDHLFCSVKSYNSRRLMELPAGHFDYVIVDEFHHAMAPSYQRLMDHVKPQVLLGMTATPERMDGLNVFHWFDDEASAEIRLPDAINRRLLCPFQYFGITDNVDLDSITWQRGGYDINELDRLYTGNDARASLVMQKIDEFLLDPNQTRALGFCVSVAHANFMARYFNDHGLSAAALSAQSDDHLRHSIQKKLVNRHINFLFVVDLYNEGVDIPEVDTILLLRPTESLTIYLQQIGRGLRLHDDKDCLTVLDFIGAQHKQFRFAQRLRALSSDPTKSQVHEVEKGFPHLPSGCAIQLERVAQQRVLENINQSLNLRRPQIISELSILGKHHKQLPSLEQAMEYLHVELDDLLKRGLWSRLLADAGLRSAVEDPDEELLAKSLRRLATIDDSQMIRFLLKWLDDPQVPSSGKLDQTRLVMFLVRLFGNDCKEMSLLDTANRLLSNPAACNDLKLILEYCLKTTRTLPQALIPELTGPLALHASYAKSDILIALGHWDMQQRKEHREGTLHLPARKIDAFMFTLHKDEADYSPTTMYEDYAISDRLFHWQSQSTTSEQSPTGQRYIHHKEMGYTPLLFVREHNKLPNGMTAPYCYLGPADYVSHQGSRPVSIIWRLRHPMPARLLRTTSKQSAS